MATGTAPTPRTMTESHGLVLHDVSWDTYCQLRDAERNNSVRMTYLDGDLTLMSPSFRHDGNSLLLSQLVRALTVVLGLTIRGIGSTTLRRGGAPTQEQGVGKEADAAFYFGDNERRIRGRQELDLSVDPPPDLAIEVENTSGLTTAARAIYARLGIPEVWRFHVADRSVRIDRLEGHADIEVDRSVVFPPLTPAHIVEALDRFEVGDFDENAWYEWIKAWVRTLPEPEGAV